MHKCTLKAVKLETSSVSDCEAFFGSVFGFAVIHRYRAEAFEEIVMTLGGEDSLVLKFVQIKDRPAAATGATIQIRLNAIEEAIVAQMRRSLSRLTVGEERQAMRARRAQPSR